MGAGIYLEKFNGKGQALLVSGTPDTDHQTYQTDAIETLQDEGYEYEEIMAMRKGEMSDNFMSFDTWCQKQWDAHESGVIETVTNAARQIIGDDMLTFDNTNRHELDYSTIPDSFQAIASSKDRSLFIGIRGWEHDHAIAVYSPKAIEEDAYYTGYDGTKLLAEEAQQRVVREILPVEMIREFEQGKINAVFENIRARLQETYGEREVYKASGGYMASFFDAPKDFDAFAEEQKNAYQQAVALSKESSNRAKNLNTAQTIEVCREQLDYYSLKERTSAVYIDTSTSEAMFVPLDCINRGVHENHIEEMGRVELPEGWQEWDGVKEGVEAASGNPIIALPDHGQALVWSNTRTVENLDRYDQGYEVPNEHRLVFPPAIIEEAGQGSEWDLALIQIQNLHSTVGTGPQI